MSEALGIIFDMDGVLIDSEPTWQRVEIAILGALGAPIDHQSVQLTTGWRIDRVVEYWRERAEFEGETEVIASRITREVAQTIGESGEALPGATELLRACVSAGLPVGLATSSSYLLIESVLRRLNIRELFSAIASASEVPEGKPDPAVYRLCMERLGLSPQECIAIEDSRTGIRSAVAAGMRCLAVHDARTPRTAAIAAGAHRWTRSLAEIRVENLWEMRTASD